MRKEAVAEPARDPDRYLVQRDGIFYYHRRMPAKMVGIDDRGRFIRKSLGTDERRLARAMRDKLEDADKTLWAVLLCGGETRSALDQYRDAVRRAEAMGVSYLSNGQVAGFQNVDSILKRVEALERVQAAPAVADALLGGVQVPPVKVSKAFDLYADEIMAHEVAGKSQSQRRMWKKVKQRAVNNFVALVGDKPIGDVTREDGLTFYRFWLKRIAPPPDIGAATHSASAGNRDLGNMRDLYRRYFAHLGEEQKGTPFDDLRFSERGKRRRKRPSFEPKWITDQIMRPGALASLDAQARRCVLALIETGTRPSEICNVDETVIFLDTPVPYVRITPREDADDPREIKTEWSVRDVPLVGVALEVFKKNPQGFPRYRNREEALSANLNKFFKTHKLFPTPKHKIYSLRHSFEDRMKEAGIDSELRKILMGHTIERVEYGTGGSLQWRRDELKKIALPFDPEIV
ncbi:DUF6538 domain-containing protein [Mesorhizobium sp. M0019]|uniref:DUF6538 domain-containing protein n=1 Tax=Mesorhizobium sp. M0019 TaxID=2956845 RepID=UPI00333D16DD